jgi:hypothetical protein
MNTTKTNIRTQIKLFVMHSLELVYVIKQIESMIYCQTSMLNIETKTNCSYAPSISFFEI